ncbi:class I SAM-dependent DNA methyltransferase [Vibrio campbellii]|uniref:class I SAM-dependent DNA methyltransferase n=1 Tax=Vibrio campbellii TaxID=680 RepID=UPI0005EE80D5|nr:class I SAM-dependent methyltransferase [Vibrio campbellii]
MSPTYSDQVVSFYDSWSMSFDSQHPIITCDNELMEKALSKVTGHVLEVGAGTGRVSTKLLNPNVRSLDIIEPAKGMVEQLQKKQLNRHANIICTKFEEWGPTHEKKYNAIVCAQVLDHVCDIDQWFQKLSSLLEKNGVLLISAVNPYFQRHVMGKKVHNGKTTIDAVLHPISALFAAWKRHGLILDDLYEHPLQTTDIKGSNIDLFNDGDMPVIAYLLRKN